MCQKLHTKKKWGSKGIHLKTIIDDFMFFLKMGNFYTATYATTSHFLSF